jgi:MFS family permease
VAATGFISTCGSSIAVPGIHSAMEDFGYTNSKVGVLITSCYVLGMGVGPFVFAPLSELDGRQIAYQSAQSLFIAFCLGSARAPT